MSALPTWLVDALDRALPMMRGRERDELAEVILAAIPKRSIADAIAGSARCVLTTRGIVEGGEISRELGNNCAQSVLGVLEVGDEGDARAEYDAGCERDDDPDEDREP